VKGYLDEVTAVAAAPVIDFTESTTFWEKAQLTHGPSS
jgi:hypothetical protein